jgi:hypothetical protein
LKEFEKGGNCMNLALLKEPLAIPLPLLFKGKRGDFIRLHSKRGHREKQEFFSKI